VSEKEKRKNSDLIAGSREYVGPTMLLASDFKYEIRS